MKNQIVYALCIVLSAMATLTANAQTCCSAPKEFAALGSSTDFRQAHLEPRDVPAPKHGATKTTLETDGEPTTIETYQAPGSPTATILVIHEWWGVNNNVRNAAHQLYEQMGGMVDVVVVDLYDGKVTDKRDVAAKLMQESKPQRSKQILQAVINNVRTNKIATIGWCFGGGWSLQASLLAKEKAAACVVYYGMPEDDIATLKMLHAPVLGIFASDDKWITPQVVSTFQANMMSAEKQLELKVYKADHAFANPSNPQYDSEATKDAWDATIRFFAMHLK